MDLFGSPNIEKMAAEQDYDGLYNCLQNRSKLVRLQAAQALAEMNDGAGWRYLIEAVRQYDDPDSQEIAAAMLGELGRPQAVPVLSEVLQKTRGDVAEAVRDALQAIPGPEAEEALRRAGYEPVIYQMNQQVTDVEAKFVRPVLTRTDDIRFLSAEEHLNNAVQLRESEMAERGLVEADLALWQSPAWGYAWYLRGVLFEDLERSLEALLSYRQALELDPSLTDARDALKDLEEEITFHQMETYELMASLTSRDWRTRRDAAAMLGEMARRSDDRPNPDFDPDGAANALLDRLDDEEREVRHAAISALGLLNQRRAVTPLLELQESSWLARFAILQALSRLGSVDGLFTALRREMNRIQERNPVFSSHKDPLLEVEYDLLMEIGVRALEATGDVETLLGYAEANTWEEVEIEDEEAQAEGLGVAKDEYDEESPFEEEDEETEEVDEDLTSYVDEVAQMVDMALERLVTPRMEQQPVEIMQRLSAVPDLTLMDVSEEEAEPVVVYDLSALREAAKAELAKRKS